MKNFLRTLVLGTSTLALAGCGADEIVSPGTSGDIFIEDNSVTNPAPQPSPTSSGSLVTPAAGCPSINSSQGITEVATPLQTPTGSYRICILPELFDTDDTIPYVPGVLYAMDGQVNVGVDEGFNDSNPEVTVDIEPGVIIFANTNRSAFFVNRGNALNSVGEADAPIIWTSRDNVLGLNDDDDDQQWGGVVLLGRGTVSDCATGAFNTDANPNANTACEQLLEGTTVSTPFGGSTDDDSSGQVIYNQIRFSGFAISPGNELQALTTGGTGSGTIMENIQTFNSSDDGIEFFGGTVNVRNLAVIGAGDDTIDADTGTQGNLQYVFAVQRDTIGDSVIELDSPADDFSTDARPQTVLNIVNFAFRQRNAAQAVRVRGGAQLNLANGIISAPNTPCVRFDEAVTDTGGSTFNSIVGDCSATQPLRATSGASLGALEAIYNDPDANNTLDTDVTFTSLFFFDTSAFTAFDVTGLSDYFEDTDFIGVGPDEASIIARFRGWTCDSSTFNFGSGSACTTLPIREGEGA